MTAASHRPVRARSKDKLQGWSAKYSDRRLPDGVDGRNRYRRADLPWLARVGCTYDEIAWLLKISRDTVGRDIIRLELSEVSRAARKRRLTMEARARYERLIGRHPGVSENALRGYEPRALRWLRRHDFDWLLAKRPKIVQWRQHKRADTTGTRGRTARLAGDIRRAARAIRGARPIRRCTLTALRRELGMTVYAFDMARRQLASMIDAEIETVQEFRVGRGRQFSNLSAPKKCRRTSEA